MARRHRKGRELTKIPEAIEKVAVEILEKESPWLMQAWLPVNWTPTIAERVRSALIDRGCGDRGIHFVNKRLHEAEMERGGGPFQPLAPKRYLRVTPSRLQYITPKDLGQAKALAEAVDRLIVAIDGCRDPLTLAGIVMISGALHSFILNRKAISTLVMNCPRVEVAAGMPIVDLAHASTDQNGRRSVNPLALSRRARRYGIDDEARLIEYEDRRHPQRHVLHDATVFLLERYREAVRGTPIGAPEEALDAACQALGCETLDLKTLTRLAMGHFATWLPSWMLEVAQNPKLCPSLDPPTWNRWMHGHHDHAPTLAPNETGLVPSVLSGLPSETPQVTDARRLRRPTAALIATLRRSRDDAPLDDHALRERLETWKATYGSLGGWLVPLHDWLVAQSIGREGGAYGSQHRLKPPGLMRYASGFFHVFIEEFREIPIHGPHNSEMLSDAIHRVVARILKTRSPLPGCVGLRSFLESLPQTLWGGMVPDDLVEVGALPVHQRTRLITPQDYLAARALLEQNYGSQDLAVRMYKVTLALAWRTGLRFGELASRRMSDIRLVRWEKRVVGDLRIEGNTSYALKTRSSKRWIPLHVFLPQQEMNELYSYIEARKSMLGTACSGDDLLFGDTATPKSKTIHRHLGVVIQDVLRKITADSNVVLHDLRHSAASLLLIRLFDEGCLRGAFDSIPGYREIRAVFERGACLSHALCGDQLEHPARPHALARLMGHLDPAMTMTYYVHTADLVIGASIRHLVTLSDDAQAAIDGVHVESVKRRKRRHRAGARTRPLRTRQAPGRNAPKKTVRRRVRERHDFGLAGSYPSRHARKIVSEILAGSLSKSRRAQLGISDEVIRRIASLVDSGVSRFIPNYLELVHQSVHGGGWSDQFDLLVENAIHKRKTSWIKQLEGLSDEPMRVLFEDRDSAEDRLRVLQQNGLCSKLMIRPWGGSGSDGPKVFGLFHGSSPVLARSHLIPFFVLSALITVDRMRPVAPGEVSHQDSLQSGLG
ncbi:site-specific integrase [Silanimonas sp.]|uniref:site-specific integrase n=1 Tax=Silanimonas sp. TaxID=1929290 RepID=UPI0022C4A34C|nr:site-specific integrase [Silanimonas sp.]MCZ8115984.1 site-specific integrase [Silanimonas sp.]